LKKRGDEIHQGKAVGGGIGGYVKRRFWGIRKLLKTALKRIPAREGKSRVWIFRTGGQRAKKEKGGGVST